MGTQGGHRGSKSYVHAVQATGEAMSSAAREFAADPCSSVKRGNMVSLVCSVARVGF